MQRDAIDFKTTKISKLFRTYLIPTLLGMLGTCAVTATDGIFIGRGVGSDGVAAVNIAWAPMMVLIGFGLMLGMGCSVVASIQLSRGKGKTARINVTQAMVAASIVSLLFSLLLLADTDRTAYALGASDALLPLVKEYLIWFTPGLTFNVWMIVGLFVIRLDGAPRLAMWCNVIPGLINALLDWLFIFPLGMGLKGAALATAISVVAGGISVIIYMGAFARTLRLIRLKISRTSIRLAWRNLGYQSRVGLPALLGEATMAMLMFTGNQVFMHYLGDDGVGAFGIACYYTPFIFMVGNAIAQSAQPIISYNYGAGHTERVRLTERLAIITAISIGVTVTFCFYTFPHGMVSLFVDPSTDAARIAIAGLPWYAASVVFFIFNLTAIGYFQSVERIWPSVTFALLRGAVFLIPSFMLMPLWMGSHGIWLALGVSEAATSICILTYYLYSRHTR